MQCVTVSGAATLGQGEPQTAAGIHTITNETVHKSNFALVGEAVPVSAIAVSALLSRVGCPRGGSHAFFIAASKPYS